MNLLTYQPRQLTSPVTDSILERLVEVGGRPIERGIEYETNVAGRRGLYPVVLTGTSDWRVDYPFFRAGKYVVLDPDFFPSFSSKIPHSSIEEFLSQCKNVSEVIFLADGQRKALSYNTHHSAQGYYLPNTVGCLIALQELGPNLSGRTVIDLGSRNNLLSIAALREGAFNALAIELEYREETLRGRTFQLINSSEFKNGDNLSLLEVNARINRHHQEIESTYSRLCEIPQRPRSGGVVVLNMPNYGLGYYDHSSDERNKSSIRLSSGMLLGYSDNITRRKSMLDDATEKFPELELAIVSGGARLKTHPNLMEDRSEDFLKIAKQSGWKLRQEITVSHPFKAGLPFGFDDWGSSPRTVNTTIDFLTFMLER